VAGKNFKTALFPDGLVWGHSCGFLNSKNVGLMHDLDQFLQSLEVFGTSADDFIAKFGPRRDLNPCYRRESGMAKRNSNKPQEHGRTGWRSRSGKKHLIVSPVNHRADRLL
jgi:hypothetical protein